MRAALQDDTQAGLNGTVEKMLEKVGGFIYEYGVQRFGVCESRKNVALEEVKLRQ